MSRNVFDVTFVSPTKTDRPSAQGRQPSENGLIGSHSPQTSSAAWRGCIAWRRVDGVKAAPAARASATITRRSCICSLRSRSYGRHRHTTVSSVLSGTARRVTDNGTAQARAVVSQLHCEHSRAVLCARRCRDTAQSRPAWPHEIKPTLKLKTLEIFFEAAAGAQGC